MEEQDSNANLCKDDLLARKIPEGAVWRRQDLTVNYDSSLPIPIVIPGSLVSYSFCTRGGDICFSLKFVSSEDGVEEIVYPPTRVPSDTETIKGSYKCGGVGALILYWDNNFSWVYPKQLDYLVQLQQPLFSACEEHECQQARAQLRDTVASIHGAQKQLVENEGIVAKSRSKIPKLEQELVELKKELEKAKAALHRARKEDNEIKQQIELNEQKKIGLAIRLLNKSVLSIVLSYLPKATYSSVCKY